MRRQTTKPVVPSRLMAGVAAGFVLFSTSLAFASETRQPLGELSLGYVGFVQLAPGDIPSRGAIDLAFHREWTPSRLPLPLRLGAGFRVPTSFAHATVPGELYFRAQLVARMGPWAPVVGPQVGLSGLTRHVRLWNSSDNFPDDLAREQERKVGPVYVAMEAAPLRFEVGAWSVSAFELLLGGSLFPAGGAARLQVGFFSLGRSL